MIGGPVLTFIPRIPDITLDPDLRDEKEVADKERHLELSLEAVRVERDTAVQLRNEGRINDAVLRRIERDLDLSESRLISNQ